MYVIGDKYDIRSLRTLALEKYELAFPSLQSYVLVTHTDSVAKLISEAYDASFPEVTRTLLDWLVESEVHVQYHQAPQLLALIRSIPDYGVDLVKHLAHRHRTGSRDMPTSKGEIHYCCPMCRAEFKTSMLALTLPCYVPEERYWCYFCELQMTAEEWSKAVVQG